MFRFRTVGTVVTRRLSPTVLTGSPSPAAAVIHSLRILQPTTTATAIYNNNDNGILAVTSRTFATSSSSGLSQQEIQKRLDEFQDLFVEARLSIEDCTDSAGTTYYKEDADDAIRAVEEAVQAFQTLIDEIDDVNEKNRILRGNGLKVEQLKGELQMALNEGGDHH